MPQVLADLFTSKKFLAALLGLVVVIVNHFGMNLDTDALMTALSPIIAYIVGQGIADHGKEQAIVNAKQNQGVSAHKL